MTPSQLSSMLELFPGPARLFNASGAVVAQNERARGNSNASNDGSDWEIGVRHDLGDGWHIRTWSKERREAQAERIEKRKNGAADSASADGARSVANSGATDISTLANSMAHSIRNPLSSIVTAAGLVADDKAISEETAMLLGIIKKEANHLNRLLTDFLQYVRPQKFNATIFDLGDTARQTVNGLKRELSAPETFNVEYSLPPLPAWGDESHVQNALWNILRNATEAMPEGGLLRLSGKNDDGVSLLCIEDSGPGFSAEELQRAFEPFFSNTPEGAGLGLSIARAAIERCNGDIRVENAASQTALAGDEKPTRSGARVYLTLPQNDPRESEENLDSGTPALSSALQTP